MPIYTFKCEQCGDIELSMGINDPRPETCPTCNSKITRTFLPIANLWKTDGCYTNRVHKD